MEVQRINKACASYPCHEGLEDCTFCYCPLYPCEEEKHDGKYLIVYQGTDKHKIWDCSGCNWVHKKNFVNEAHKILKEYLKTKNNGTND
jgi:Zn-finger protein